MNVQVQLDSLSKLSWMIVITSMLIETSNARGFPSYNIVIGFLGVSFKYKLVPKRSILLTIACFCILVTVSIIIDIIYCSLWGKEILEGLNKATKFSFFLLMLNSFLKLFAFFYALAAQISLSVNLDVDLSSRIETIRNNIDSDLSLGDDIDDSSIFTAPIARNLTVNLNGNTMSTPSNLEMTAITPIKRENDSSNNTGTLQTSFQEVDIERNDLPFSPGVPGLLSPVYPRRLSHGWTPPNTKN